MCANPEPMLQRHTTKPQTLRFSSHTSLFWTLPEQLSMLHHACEPTHPEPTSQDTLQTSIRKCSSLISLFRTLPEQLGKDDTTHLCQPWTNVAKTHHKTSDPKIFISHIPLLNFAGATLHITPRMCANPSWRHTTKHSDPKIFISHIPLLNFAGAALQITPRMCANPEPTSQKYTTKPQTLRFLSHTFLFWTLPEQITPRMCANPEPMLQRHNTKPQTLRFSSHTSLFWTLPEQLSILHHACEPTHPEPTSQDTLQISIRKFSSHTSLFWTLPEQITPRMCANPEPMLQRHTTKPQTLRFSSHTSLFWTLPEQLSILHHACVPTHPEDTPQNLRPQDFHLTHPSFELCRSSSPDYTTHVCQPWTNVPKIHHKTSDPKIFISHIPVLNFAGAALHNTPRMWANPSWTNVPRHSTNFNPKIFISHIPVLNFAGTDCTSHVCQPWTNVAKTQHKTSDPKIFISHIPVLNFAGAALHITPRMWVPRPTHPEPTFAKTHYKTCQKSTKPKTLRFSSHTSLFWTLPEQLGTDYTTHVPTHPEPTSQWHTTKPQIRKFSSHTSLFWTLPEQLGTDYTTHVCQPILNQRSKDTPQNLRP